jgi:hypothetical protein
LVENRESLVEKKEEKYKLWPTNTDRPAFQTVHACNSLGDLDKALIAKPALVVSNIVAAYRYFHTNLSAWIRGELDEQDEPDSSAVKTLTDRLDALWQVVKSGLQLVVINLGTDDETQVIFETLNARGTDLLPADLIKNYLFRSALSQRAEVETLYADSWVRFETSFWREEVQQGRLKRPRIDLFFSHYLTLMTQDEVKSTHLFNAFKAFVEDAAPSNQLSAADHIEQLARYADVFDMFYRPTGNLRLARFLRLLESVDTATVFPFLLYAHAELMPARSSEFDKILAILETFLMRRLVLNWTSKNYNRLFVDLIKAVGKDATLTARSVASFLGKGTGESTRFPTDAELRTCVTGQPLYGRIAQFKVRAVLESLEAELQSSKSPILALTEKLTIEHIMPQTWRPYWDLPQNSKTDALSEQKATTNREFVLNTLGNLTLITGSFNSSLQNAAWPEKRPELLKYGKLNLTQYFHLPDANDWNEEAIEKRTAYLFEKMLNIWPDLPQLS